MRGDELSLSPRFETRIAVGIRKPYCARCQMTHMAVAENKIRGEPMTAGHAIVSRIVVTVIRRVSIRALGRSFFKKQKCAGRRCERGLGDALMKTHRRG